MFKKFKVLNNKFDKITKRGFFLKYLEKQNFFAKNTSTKEESINIKELIDEKNVKITFSDIIRDYRYFRVEYYFFNQALKEEEKEPKLPFKKEEMTFNKVRKYLLSGKEKGNKVLWKHCFYYCIIVNFIAFYIKFRIDRARKRNYGKVEKLEAAENKENISARKSYETIKIEK